MRPLLYVVSALIVMALAFWAYRENYATQRALRDLAALQDQIATLREDIAMQRAEWAYLNRPDRLRALSTANFDRLELLPLTPEQMTDGKVAAYPLPASATDDTATPAAALDGGVALTGATNLSGGIVSKPEDKAFP